MRKRFWFIPLFWILTVQPGWGQFSEASFLQSYLLPFELPGLDLNFSGAGAAARGMSGAFVGVSGNLSAIGFNPAGLASLDRPQTALVYRYNRPSLRNRQFGAAGSGFDNQISESFDQVDFGALAATGKLFGHPFVGAVAYTVFADQFFSDQFNDLAFVQFPNEPVISPAELNVTRRVSGKLTGFNLGAASRFGPFSFGATFQIYQGGFSDTTASVVGPVFLRPDNGQDTGHILPAVDRQRVANKADYRGSSLILGAQADYKSLRLGVAARIPSLFQLKSNMDIGFYDSFFLSGLYQRDQSLPEFLPKTDSRLELPLSLTTGLAYRLGRSLLVDFDYTYTNWGAADLKVRRYFQAPFSNQATLELGSSPVGLTSTHQLRLGGELEINSGFGRLFIRGGVRNLPVRTLTSLLPLNAGTIPIDVDGDGDIDSIYTFPNFGSEFKDSFVVDAQGNVVDTISTVSLQYVNSREDPSARGKIWQHFGASFGLGIHWNQVALDIAYDYSTYRRNNYDQTFLQGEVTTSRQVRQHRLFVGLTGYFTRI